MRIAVIIPTYNEAGSIVRVLDELFDATKHTPHEWLFIVVDGHSSDNTAALVRERMQTQPSIRLVEEPEKRGIAAAYLTGIRYAREVEADAFAEFDGDGQHDPRDLVRMAEALTDTTDHVIGSRYIPGGSIPAEWAWYRKFISRFGSLYARLLLELPVHDVTSGLKLTRLTGPADAVPKTEDDLLTRHYAYKIQFLAALADSGARITEVPIAFRAREHDVSKSTVRDLYESLRVTAHLRIRNLRRWRLLRVVAIGGIGFIIQTVIFELLGIRSGVVSASTAAVIGGECAILSNFLLNERFTFRDRIADAASFGTRLLRFHIVSSGSILLQWLLLFTAESLTTDVVILRSAYLLGIALGFVLNYTGYYFFVWQGRDK